MCIEGGYILRKSARIMGQDYGLTAQEMNFVLKEEGYLDGEPGSYSVTEKGSSYAVEEDHHRGTGGYSWYNRYWTTRTWDDSIQDEIEITDERKKEIREALALAKQKIRESEDTDISISSPDTDMNSEDVSENDDSDPLVLAIGALIVGVSVYGIYKAAPYVKNWWNDKAVPGIKEMKNRISGKTTKLRNEVEDDVKSVDNIVIESE